MRIEINTQAKTITLKDSIKIGKLLAFMKDLKIEDYDIVPEVSWTYYPTTWPYYPYQPYVYKLGDVQCTFTTDSTIPEYLQNNKIQ